MKNLYSISVAALGAAIPLYLLRLNIFGIPTNVFEVLVVAVVMIGLLQPTIRSAWRVAERQLPRPVIYCVSLFLAAALLSVFISDVPRVSFGIFKSWIIIPLLLGWVVYTESRIWNFELRIRHALILSGVVVSLVSLGQFTWGERLAGIYDVPNSLALYLAPLIMLAVVQAFSPAPPAGGWRREGVICSFAALFMFCVLVLTQSVAGIAVVLIVAGGILTLRLTTFPHFEMWKGPRVALAVVVLGVAVLTAGLYLEKSGRLSYLTLPLTTGEPNSISVRLQLWSISWDIIKENPLLGVGLGQFEPAYQQKLHEHFSEYETARQSGGRPVAVPLSEFVYRDPHNWILSFWLNTGLLGLISFASLHMWLFWKSRHALATNYQIQATAAALLVLLLFGLVDTMYWKNDLSALHWVLLGLIVRDLEAEA